MKISIPLESKFGSILVLEADARVHIGKPSLPSKNTAPFQEMEISLEKLEIVYYVECEQKRIELPESIYDYYIEEIFDAVQEKINKIEEE